MTDQIIPEGQAAAVTNAKLDQLLRLADEQVHLQRVSLLEDGHILSFTHAGQRIRFSIPDASRDYIQRVILRSHGFFERALLAKLEAASVVPEGATIYDIGANIGNHTVYFSKVMKARKVVALEPQLACFDTLKDNVKLNALKGVKTHACALGSGTGTASVTGFKPYNSGGTMFTESADGDFELRSLDDVVAQEKDKHIDFMKIDVEGMQMAVLSGADNVLSSMKPAIWVELLAKEDEVAETSEFLAGYGYRAQQLGPQDYLFLG